jgi:hypothetical protein
MQIIIGEMWQCSEINIILGERLRVPAETESFEPLCDVVRHSDSSAL